MLHRCKMIYARLSWFLQIRDRWDLSGSLGRNQSLYQGIALHYIILVAADPADDVIGSSLYLVKPGWSRWVGVRQFEPLCDVVVQLVGGFDVVFTDIEA